MPPRRKTADKRPDITGNAVFYPEQVPRSLPPPRRPSRAKAKASTSLSDTAAASQSEATASSSEQPSVLLPQGPLSAFDPGAFANELIPLFPPQATLRGTASQQSPPTQLADRLQGWTLFTPSPANPATRPPYTFGTGGTLDTQSPISPLNFLLSDVNQDSDYQEQASPLARSPLAQHAILEEDEDKAGNDDDPFSRAILYNTTPVREQFRGGGGDTFFGSPYAGIDRPLLSPLPQRQLPWSNSDRRASTPGFVRNNVNPFSQPLFVPPGTGSSYTFPSAPPRSFSLSHVDDFFDPGYAASNSPLAPPEAARSLFPNDLDLDFLFPVSTRQPADDEFTTEAMPSSPLAVEQHSEIAARYLHGHTLDPDFLAEYQLRDELGSGGFGFVCSAVQTGVGNVAGIEVAVKFIFKNRINEHDYTEVNGEPVESYVLRKCDHPGIIKFLALFEDDEFFYLVQEIHGRPWSQNAALGCEIAQATSVPTLLQQHFLNPFSASPINHAMNLPSPLYERPGMARRASYDLFEAVEHRTFDEDQARHIFRQLVSAVQYMHSRGLYHRDLKDENIVMDEHLVVKIIDFGSAVVENRLLSPVLHSQFRGTTTYAAPEVLNGESYHAGPADVWALGIILSIILTGTSPFETTDHARCGRMRFNVPISLDAEHLLGRCLTVDGARRATINEIAQHRWFRNGFKVMRPF